MNHQLAGIPRVKIARFCKQWKVKELSLFGSILRGDFTETSDIDVLITFHPDAQISLFDLAQMQIELQNIFGRQVDLVEKAGLRNPYRRAGILKNAEVIYAAR